MKEHYDHIVVGGGISGLTVTLLLARQGRRVLLLEKGPRLGGSIARFRRGAVPFDVGFHFTGGFARDRTGMLDDMLAVLGIGEAIEPIFLPDERCHRVAFPSCNALFEIPCGIERYREKLKSDFPDCRQSIDAYFKKLYHVCDNTTALDIRRLAGTPATPMDEDYVSLQDVLDELIGDRLLQAVLSTFCMCHGSRPEEISFADHCRIAFGLYESTARVRGGGEAFLNAFRGAFRSLDVEIGCSTTITELEEINDRRVHRFLLSDGREIGADSCVFTIHPLKIMELLPEQYVTPAFKHRIAGFEPSAGFFSLFGVMNGRHGQVLDGSIFSIFPDIDINRIMSPQWEGDRPLVLLPSREKAGGKPLTTLTALELSLPQEVSRWQNSTARNRDETYAGYKRRQTQSIQQRITRYHPSFTESFTLLETASMLTYRDYLYSPFGSAYGIKQKVGQFNLVGKMPLLNLYAAGQSAMLPGVVGAMSSGLFISRALIGKDKFRDYIGKML